MRTTPKTFMTIASITIVCGLAIPASAQNATAPKSASSMKASDAPAARIYDFDRADTLIGADITNPNGSAVGSVKDFIIDRGTGSIRYIVVRNGGLFGLGGKEVAIPYEYFQYDPWNDGYSIGMTDEMIKRTETFTPSEWIALDSKSWTEKLSAMYLNASEQFEGYFDDDPYEGKVKASSLETMKGRITAVKRTWRPNGDQSVSLEINTGENRNKTVELGPSWYVMSQPLAPMTGDTVEINAFEARTGKGTAYVARTLTINGESMALREKDGAPRWIATSSTFKDDPSVARTEPAPLLLVSELTSRDATARAEKAGEVQDVIIEHRSGTVAFFVIDPNENILGIGDDLHLVPWNAASIGDRAVRIDADTETMKRSMKLPDTLDMLNSRKAIQPVYNGFNTDVAEFTPREQRGARGAVNLDGWSNTGALAKAYRAGKTETIGGSVKSVSTHAHDASLGSCSTVTIKDPRREGDVVIHLAPAWFFEHQPVNFSTGDELAITARKIQLKGETFYIASSVSKDGRVMRFWKDDAPVWDAY